MGSDEVSNKWHKSAIKYLSLLKPLADRRAGTCTLSASPAMHHRGFINLEPYSCFVRQRRESSENKNMFLCASRLRPGRGVGMTFQSGAIVSTPGTVMSVKFPTRNPGAAINMTGITVISLKLRHRYSQTWYCQRRSRWNQQGGSCTPSTLTFAFQIDVMEGLVYGFF